MTTPLSVAFNSDRTRAAFRFSHSKGNIITAEMVELLTEALSGLDENPHLKLITLEGAGADFSFGASVPEHVPEEIARVLPAMHELIYALLDAPAPTAAVVRGRCLGGGFELALACDFIFASDDATFGLPEVALGVFAPAGSVLLGERIGAARATRALVTGETRSAAELLAMGLVELVAPGAALSDGVDRWFTERLARRSAATLRYVVQAARAGLRTRVRALLPELERLYLRDLMQTRDAPEGIAAFLQKRAPRWQDR
jgi:cyclohexa-1,5-dienecarbonyl-CoA hydratase